MFEIVRRNLSKIEASLLVQEMRNFPDIVYFSESHLSHLPHTFVAEIDGQFAGVCGVYEIGTWIKLGPLVVLQEYHGRGLGRALIQKVLQNYPNKNFLIISSNTKVQRIALTSGFAECRSFFALPNIVKFALARQLVHMLNTRLILEKIRKSIHYKRGPMRWYVRYNAM